MTGFRPKNSLWARMRSARNVHAYTRGEHAELARLDGFAVIDQCLIDRSKIDRCDSSSAKKFFRNFLAKIFLWH